MTGYPHGAALIAACTSGRGTIVVFEGETAQDDAYYFGRWFGERGREVTFIPQNGWEKVVEAVALLRSELPDHRRVFGIVDRDYADDLLIRQQLVVPPRDGVYRTPGFTVENYLLAPRGWLEVVHVLTRGAPPSGWRTLSDLEGQVRASYSACLEVAAFNRVVREEWRRSRSGEQIKYAPHPKALTSPATTLDAWGARRGAPDPLGAVFDATRQTLAAAPEAWSTQVSGKVVLKDFLERFPQRLPHALLVSLYIDKYPDAPDDLKQLVDAILRGA